MDRTQKGFTLIEILVVVTIIGVLAGLVVVLIPKGKEKASIAECQNNVRNLSGLFAQMKKLPTYSGVNLLLVLHAKGDLPDEGKLKLLFCPGDETGDSLERAGGLQAYKDVDLKKNGEYGNLSSYAGRDQLNRDCAASVSSMKTQAIISDDSEDHHNGKGFVVGYTDGSAKFRDKFDDWQIAVDTEVKVGEGSSVEELKCLRTDDN